MRIGPGNVVVVTGASGGIGRATARALGARGAWVALVARGRDGLAAAKREIERAGGRAMVCPADVADARAVEELAERVEQQFGPIDVWINCAMVTVFSPFERMTPDEFRRVTEVTYLGYVWGTMAALKRMRERDRGTIVQVGSALSYRGIPLQSAYCGAKHAIRGFTDSLRSELIHDGCRVRLSMVQLPAHNTPQFDWNRNHMSHRPQPVSPIFQPEVAADSILEAAERAPRELWVGGPSLQIILGNMLAPSLLDRMLAKKGYEGQTTDEPALPRPDNLYEPRRGDWGAHGRFDDRASGGGAVRVDQATLPLVVVAGALGVGAALFSLGMAARR